jgi:hypothetical protein
MAVSGGALCETSGNLAHWSNCFGSVERRNSLIVTTDEVLTFLRLNFPDRYCATCLALKLGGTLALTGELMSRLRDMGVVLAGIRQCCSCGREIEVFTRRVGVRLQAP